MSERDEKTFYCRECVSSWKTDAYHIGDDDVAYSKCECCDKLTHEVPHYYANIPKMIEAGKGKSTGPKTKEGKARVALNGYKHGLASRKFRILAPAKKGKYPECDGCPYFDDCTPDKYCPINLTEITKFAAAYKNGKIEFLKEFAGVTQGNLAIIMKMLFNDIFTHGTLVEKVISSKVDENTDTEEIVKEWQDNPSLKHLLKLAEAMGSTADQQMMTPAKQTENENIEGFVNSEKVKAETAQEHYKKRDELLEKIHAKMANANINRKQDEALQEFENQEKPSDD